MKHSKAAGNVTGLLLLVLFLWIGSYAFLRVTKTIEGTRVSHMIIVNQKLYLACVIYRPLTAIEQKMTGEQYTFAPMPIWPTR